MSLSYGADVEEKGRDVEDKRDVIHSEGLDASTLDYAAKSKIDTVNAGQLQNLAVQDRQVAWELARQIDPGPKWYSWRGIKFVFYCMVVCVGNADGSFDGTLMSSIVSMSSFLDYFHIPAIASTNTGIILGIAQVGGVVAFFPSAWLPDKFGRKASMIIGNILVILGALVCGLAKNNHALMGGRFLLGIAGVGASGVYIAEICHASNRGKWLGVSNVFWYVGNIMATGVCIPFGKIDSNWAWRIPLLMQVGPCLVNAAFIPFIPESPRWLLAHGHRDKALRILADLHSEHNDINSPVVQHMIQELDAAISTQGADLRLWSFKEVFKGRANWYRWWMGCIITIWGQLSGQGIPGYFLPAALQEAGITDGNRQRVLNLGQSLTCFGCALAGSLIIDRVGRRFLFFWAESVAIIGLAILGGLTSPSGEQSITRANAAVAFMILFSALFAFGMTPLQRVYSTEVFKYENRAKALALQGLIGTVTGCITQFGVPPMLGALSYKAYFIFMVFDIVGITIIYFFVVETKQLSLEDLDEVFESPHPKETSLQLVKDAKIMARQEQAVLSGQV